MLTAFASWLRYCSDVAQRRPTKLCTIFDRLLGWYTIYTFLGSFAPWRNFATCKIHFASKSCVLVYWQRYCIALQKRASAKLCGVVRVGRWSRRTFSTDFEIFRRRFDGVVIYIFNPDFKSFDDASEFSVTSLYIVFFYFLFKVHVNFSSTTAVFYMD